MMPAGILLLLWHLANVFIACDGNVPRAQIEKTIANAEALVTQVNELKISWKAKLHHKFAKMTPEEQQQLMGVRRPFPEKSKKKGTQLKSERPSVVNTTIPVNFDARQYFPKCAGVIDKIQDQSACGSCWAVSVASVITDRICIASDGAQRVNISALDLLSCETHSFGCNGGWEDKAFEHYVKSGLCTGSDFGAQLGCKPYPWAPVAHPSQVPLHKTPNVYNMTYAKDKYYGKNARVFDDGNVEAIQAEIMRAGPVTAAFLVYEDFVYYASGVYQHVAGKVRGGHAVRIIGWGYDTDSKLPYWLVANSWNSDWGDDGFFRIRMGTDECGFETWGISFADANQSED
uniref:Putative effector protein n=1 Tax=Heterodera avenae TaxID=34510 RepID=A0A2L0VDH8_HETAV|nr:putative effector protein [Heterodera avenae]